MTLVALCSAGATYFMGSYGISIDTVMVQNVFETNATEAGDLVNPTCSAICCCSVSCLRC